MKIIFADKTEVEIAEGHGIYDNTVIVDDFSALGSVAEKLAKEGNLSEVKYNDGKADTGVYKDMVIDAPLFKSVDYTDDKKVVAVFGIREKTVYEKEMDKVKLQLSVHDAAVTDLGEVVSQISQA